MKKIFFFAAAMLAAVSMSAQTTLYDWSGNVGVTTMYGTTVKETVKVKGTSVDCISLKNAFKDNNGVKIAPANGSFLVGDLVNVEFCINNQDGSKTAVLAVYGADTTEVTYASANNTYDATVEASKLQYALTADAVELFIGRKSGNTKCCIVKMEVVRGGEVIPVAAAKPIFSVAAGRHFEPFKVAIESSNADKIFYSLNNAAYVEYTDSLLIDQYDVDYAISAFATIEDGENSDTASISYKLEHFIARPIFNARVKYEFAGITAEDIQIQTPATATMGTYPLDGKTVPSVNYVNAKHEDRDSFMVVSIKDREKVLFRYKNGQNKNNIMKFAADYTQCDGSNFEMWVDSVKGGDTIVFVVTAKGSAPRFDNTFSTACYIDPYQPDDDTDPCYTDGLVMTASDAKIDNDYSGWQNLVYTVQEGHSRIRIKEVANGFRLAKILVGAYRGELQAVENVNATVKAIKRIENGQLVIIKNGVRYNALGTQL